MRWRAVLGWGMIAMGLFGPAARADQVAPARPDRFWLADIGAAFGQDIIGSEDTRRGGIYGVGYAWREPRLTYRRNEPHLIVTGYTMFTKGGGFEDIPVNQMRTWGVSVVARYWSHWIRGWNTYLDLGWGGAYNSIRTRDLDRRSNSTPIIGVGVALPTGRTETYLSVRFYHMSNAGTRGNNQGMNQVQFLAGVRF